MKKTFLALSAVTMLFAACQEKDPNNGGEDPNTPSTSKEFNKIISNDMVVVEGVAEEALVIVDNSDRTIDIEIAYADKAELAALTVSFKDLPDGVSADPATSTFDYSDGKAKEITFSCEGFEDAVYSIVATAATPRPHFVSLSVGGKDVSGSTVSFSGRDNLSALAVAFTVVPEETVVKVGGVVIESGAEVDFTDKINGVTFTLECEGASESVNVKVVTTGISRVETVWGHYFGEEWTNENLSEYFFDDNMRNIAIDDKYVYFTGARIDKIGAISLDGSEFKTLADRENPNGLFKVCGIRCIKNGSGYVTLVSNMVNAAGNTLCVYKYDSVDAQPDLVLSYTLAESNRLGDKMTVSGDWSNGSIWFCDYQGSGKIFEFEISGGKVSSTPKVYNAGFGNSAAIYCYSDNEYLWSAPGHNSVVYERSGDSFSSALELTKELNFGISNHGFNFFEFNGQNYMCYTNLENNWMNGRLRIVELNGLTLKESLENNNISEVCYSFALGTADDYTVEVAKNGNATQDCSIFQNGDDTYIAALSTQHGIRLVKFVK